jgi:hypothetical protein
MENLIQYFEQLIEIKNKEINIIEEKIDFFESLKLFLDPEIHKVEIENYDKRIIPRLKSSIENLVEEKKDITKLYTKFQLIKAIHKEPPKDGKRRSRKRSRGKRY